MTDDPTEFHKETHLLRDAWKMAAESRIAALREQQAQIETEIGKLGESIAEMTAFTSKVIGMPRLTVVEWTAKDQRMAEKWSAQSAGDRQPEQKAA